MRIRTRSAGVAALLAVAACVAPPIETSRSIPAAPAQVRGAVEAELAALGLTRVGTQPDEIEATAAAAPPAWAACPPVLVGDGEDRRRMASPDRRQAVVRIAIRPDAAGTQITIAASFTAAYRNPFSGYGSERACHSRGVVETRLLAAAGSGSATSAP